MAAAVACWLCPFAVDAGEIRVWPTASVAAPQVRLTDVASLSGFSPEQTAALSQLTVVLLAEDGARRTLDVAEIRGMLDAARVNWADIRLIGATRCDIDFASDLPPAAPPQRPARPNPVRSKRNSRGGAVASARGADRVEMISTAADESRATHTAGRAAADRLTPSKARGGERTLESAVRDHIAGELAGMGGQVDVRFGAAAAAGLSLREPEYRFSVRSRGHGDNRLGMRWFDVQAARGDAAAQSIPVLAEVTLLRPVVVAARIINSGQEISARDVRLEARPFQRIEDIGQTDLAAVIGMEARRAMRPGDIFKAQDVRNQPLVRRNQLVTIWSRAGGVVVQSSGRATRDGWLGDEIEIRAEGSEQKFSASVSGPGTVALGDGAASQVARR